MNNSDKDSETTGRVRHLPQIALITVGIVTILLIVLDAAGQLILGEGLLILALASYFPLSYVAYETFQSESRVERLTQDFRLLGMQQEVDPGEMAQRLYGRTHNRWNYLLNILLVVLLTIVGMALFIWPPVKDWLDVNTLYAMQVGFLGAYLFAAQLTYRRYTTSDIQPAIYLNGALTIVAGLAFNFIAFEAINSLSDAPTDTSLTGVSAGLTAVLAFALGYFPNLALTWFSQIAYSTLGVNRRSADELPLSLIDGISQWHEARLRDIGIDNIQNLAAYDITELLLKTTFSGYQVIDWIDQALLFLYLGARRVDRFREAGIRTVSDFREMWEKGDNGMKQDIATQLQTSVPQLQLIHDMTKLGPNLAHVLRYWNNVEKVVWDEQKYYLMRKEEESRREYEEYLDMAATAKDMAPIRAGIKQLRDEMRMEPGAKGVIEPTTARRWVGLGNVRWADGDISEAIECYQKAIQMEPDYALAHSRLGQANLALGRLTLAGKNFERAVELDRNPQTLNDRGAYYLETGQIEKARTDLEEAVDSNPNMPEVYVNLGRIYEMDGDIEQAIESYKKAIAVDADHPDAYNNLAWLYVGVLEDESHFDEAVSLAERAVELSRTGIEDRPRPNFLHTLGVVQWRNGDMKTAKTTLQQAQAYASPGSPLQRDIKRSLVEIEEGLEVASNASES